MPRDSLGALLAASLAFRIVPLTIHFFCDLGRQDNAVAFRTAVNYYATNQHGGLSAVGTEGGDFVFHGGFPLRREMCLSS